MPALTMSVGISTFRLLRVSLTSVRSAFIRLRAFSAMARQVVAQKFYARSAEARQSCAASEGVRKGGVEPPKPFGYRILSPARLPVPPLSRERERRVRVSRDAGHVGDEIFRHGT